MSADQRAASSATADQGNRRAEGAGEMDYTRRAAIAVGLLAAAAGLLLLFSVAGQVLFLAFAGLLLGVLLWTLSDWVSSYTPLSYGWALLAVVLVLVGLLAAGGWLLGSQIASQVDQLAQAIPTSIRQLEEYLSKYQWGRWLMNQAPNAGRMAQRFDLVSRVTGAASAAAMLLTYLVIILFVGLYTAAEPRLYTVGMMRLVPPRHRQRGREVVRAVAYNLRWWLLGQLLAMTVVGALTGAGLWLLGVKMALALGLLAFALEIIPNLGPILAAIPAVLVSLGQGGAQVWYVILLYVAVQTVESYVVMPIVQRQAVWLPPAVAILAVVLLGLVGGVLGVLVAAPLTVTVIVLVKMLYVEDTLGDRSVEVPGEPSG